MKKIIKLVVIAGFLVGGALLLFSRTAPVSALAMDDGDSAKSLYEQNCARCHGADGKADTDKGRELSADDLTASKTKGKSLDRITSIITNGRDDMPAYAKKMSPEQIKAVAEYIKTL